MLMPAALASATISLYVLYRSSRDRVGDPPQKMLVTRLVGSE